MDDALELRPLMTGSLLRRLREEILSAITKHVTVERDSVQVRMDRGPSVSTLAIDVEIPHSNGMLLATGS